MREKKMDFAKMLAILSQPKEELPPLANVVRKTVEVPFITKDGQVKTGSFNLVMPENAPMPMSAVFVPHYPMGEDSVEMRSYLAEGWAVASPVQFDPDYNAKLMDDDLVFNNAALYTLKRLPEIDADRVALVGGSAGGYMTLMLSGLQLGTCCAIANGPIANSYFNFFVSWPKENQLNQTALVKLLAEKAAKGEANASDDKKEENPALAVMKSVMKLPIPFIAALNGGFVGDGSHFPAKEDIARWEALTGVGVADCFSHPMMVNHNMSDILVPVDQISKRFTYAVPGGSLPADLDLHMPADLPGKIRLSLEEALPAEKTRCARIPVPENAPETDLPYDAGKRFNINIFDDGAPEGYGSHSARMDVGRRLDIPYLKEQLAKGASQTNALTPAMLKKLLLRYLGKDLSLPAHEGVDDAAYGSLVVYQKEGKAELSDYAKHHGADAVNAVFQAISVSDPENQADLAKAFSAVMTGSI